MSKRYLDIDVYTAAVDRLDLIFERFERIYVSFSGGKDSGLLLHLALECAARHKRGKLSVLFIDFEAQYKCTADYVREVLSRPDVDAYWVCLPIHLRNAVSQLQPHWLCWDPSKIDAWVRPLPEFPGVIADQKFFPFFRTGMEFEEFTPEFGEWFAKGEKTACLVGIRASESLNRYRTVKNRYKETFDGLMWTTKTSENVYNFYPLYDWRTQDVWAAHGKRGFAYNSVYDLMHLAGVPLSSMRLCQPFGDDQRKGLHLFRILEPDTWARIVQRVEGANFGCRHAGGKILGNYRIKLPPGHTYKSYTKFLLATMPPYLARHYRRKIFKFLVWWKKNRKRFNVTSIPDAANPKLEARRIVPSWRRICKVVLRNDYWCRGLSFSQTKKEMERQLALMADILPKGITDEDRGR